MTQAPRAGMLGEAMQSAILLALCHNSFPAAQERGHGRRSVWVKSFLVWLAIIFAEVVHGIARALLLAPRLGELRSRQVGVVIGSMIILAIATASIRWIGTSDRRHLWAIGFLWVILTLAFEFGFGRLALGYSWERLLSDYNPAQGGFLLIGMVVLLLAPQMAARFRR